MKVSKEIAQILINTFNQNNRVYICGNGGSAAESSHFVGELLCKLAKWRKPLPAFSLSDLSVITAIANDLGFDQIFSRQIEAYGQKGDVLVTLSTSGKSLNILNATREATIKEMITISLPTNEILKMNTTQTQEIHLKMIHEICQEVEDYFFDYSL